MFKIHKTPMVFMVLTFMVLWWSEETCCFNLETRIPIIKKGSTDTYFGFSVAEHLEVIDNSTANPQNAGWLLVGAPLGQNRQPGTNRSGALHKCPITTYTDDCIQVITDGRESIETDNLIPPNTNNEQKDNQWLGVTVRSGGVGPKILVCAHRHIVKKSESLWGQGQCYVLKNNFQYYEYKRPCSGKVTEKAHEQYGYCQAGTSGLITPADEAVIGLPGPLTWRGLIYAMNVSEDYLGRDGAKYYSREYTDEQSKYSYLGMSVTVGKYFGKELLYAGGAPRLNGVGQVIFFKKVPHQHLIQNLTIRGEQFGSGFGYELASADVNGDEITDLIVAAPFYFGKGEGGAVYVYTKLCKNTRESEKCKPTKLVGKEESRFGFAVSNLNDLNKDGYEDIAVGAPYEGKGTVYIYLGSKHGLITIPSQIIHSEDTPMPLKSFGYSLSGGIDMDNNGYPDLLVGAYEADAVLLLRARKIIDIVTFIKYQSKNGTFYNKIDPIDPTRVGCNEDPNSSLTCFTFEACCQSASILQDERIKYLRLKAYIEAETYSGSKKFARIRFGQDKKKLHYVDWIATLNSNNNIHCRKETVYLKEGTRDIQSPIKFRLNYTLIQDEPVMPKEGSHLPNINNYPILNQQEAARVFQASFQKDCGNNDICESDLRLNARLNLTQLPNYPNFYELPLGVSPEVIVDINLINVGESAYETQLFVAHSPSLNYIGTKQNESAICSLYNTTLVSCAIGNPFKKDKSVSIQVRFDPKELENDEVNLSFLVSANSTSKEVGEKKPIKLQAKVLKRAELTIKGSSKTQWAIFGGPVMGESAIKKLSHIGPKVAHVYEIFNEGPWKVTTLNVIISWPFEVANDKPHGKWLLYLEENPLIQAPGGGECHVPAGQVNPLNLQRSDGIEDTEPLFPKPSELFKLNHTSYIRRKRDKEKVVTSKITIDKDGHRHQVVSMNCKAGTAKCFDIICTISNLQKKEEAIIILKARLWNSTLAEDYPKADMVRIGSNARISVPRSVVIQQDNYKDDFAMAETIAYPDLLDLQEAEPVPIYIIIVAIVAGLLLLILLTLILWKLGFFKRRRPDHTLSGNLQKHKDDSPENEALVKHATNVLQ